VRHALFRQRLRHGPASRVTPHRQQRDHFSAQAMKSQPEIQSFAAVFLEYPLRHQRFAGSRQAFHIQEMCVHVIA
jgi:hypothetical protein